MDARSGKESNARAGEDDGPMVDLNSLIPSGSSLQLTFAVAINDRGEIAGFGVPPGCAPKDVDICGHAYVLIPCDEKQGDSDSCKEGAASATLAQQTSTSPNVAGVIRRRPGSQGMSRIHFPGTSIDPRN